MKPIFLEAAHPVVENSKNLDWTTIIVTLITVVGAGGVIKVIKAISDSRKAKREEANADGVEYRSDLKKKVQQLDKKVEDLQKKIEEIIKQYSEEVKRLSVENAELKTKLEFYKRRVKELDKELDDFKKN